MYRQEMALVIELCHDPLNIVIVGKAVEIDTVPETHLHLTPYRVSYLKVIMIIVSAVERFVQRVIGNRMQRSGIDPA